MDVAIQARTNPPPNVCQRLVLRTNPKGSKTECVFGDGTAILISNFMASLIHARDELRFPLELDTADAGTQIYIRKTNPEERRRDIFQAEIGYVTQPRKDRRDNLSVAAEVRGSCLGISAINLRCETLRDYFYVGNRRHPWDRQPSFYELLRVHPSVSPAELRIAFKLRSLELRTAQAPTGDLRALERAFNTLAQPELRACYDTLRNDPTSPAPFPRGGFGSLLVAGGLSKDGKTFYASRILVKWETALPSRLEVALPSNIAEQVAEARRTHHRFGEFAEALDHIRARLESVPIERSDLQKLCSRLGMPGDFDVASITWKPDYDAFFYNQLCRRARCLYLFRSEYIFDLERMVVVETPQLGHATYLFSKPASMSEFLTIYSKVARGDILRNHSNVAERLGFLGRLIHGLKPGAWLKDLKVRVGEPLDYAEASVG